MRRFSIGTSIGDAFKLIRARPLAVFVWGLLTVAPILGGFALILPTMGDMFANLPASGSDASGYPDRAFAQMMQFQMASMLMNVGQLLVMAVVYTAIMRAMLRPKETSFFSLRVGMDELRVAVVGLAIGVAMYIAMIIVVLFAVALAVAVGLGAGMTADSGVGIASISVVLVIVGMFGFLWAMARVSMMAPASVLYRDFAFVQGWKLATGKGWSLLGMMLLIFVVVILIEVIVIVIGVGLFAGFAVATGPWDDIANAAEPFTGMAAWLAANWYWAALAALAVGLIYGLVLTLTIAPFASACRQLAEGDGPRSIDEGSPESAA
jgi:hypothetical protein